MLINILVDLAIILTVLLGFMYGYKRGLFLMTAGPARRLLCFALSFSYSGVVGSRIVAPILKRLIDIRDNQITKSIVNGLSTVIAFVLLFLLTKVILSFTFYLIGRILDSGLIGIVNNGVGMALSGMIAFGLSVCLVSVMDYLYSNDYFSDVLLMNSFSGGPLYRLLKLINPIGRIPPV